MGRVAAGFATKRTDAGVAEFTPVIASSS